MGFLTVRVGSRAASIATVATVLMVGGWAYLATEGGQARFSYVADRLPDVYWIGVLPHVFLIAVGCLLSLLLPRRSDKSLENLTIWTKSPEQPAE